MADQNPSVIRRDDGYTIQYVRAGGAVLAYIQDLSGRKMKSSFVNRPVVVFASRREAEIEVEVENVVIPYLLNEKGVDEEDIIGW
jgi:hypothetical protein